MSRALSSFSVAELDALPVGSRFVDRNIRPELVAPWAFTKHADGGWAAPESFGYTSREMVEAGEFPARDPYVLDDGPTIPDPRTPFLAYAALLSPSAPNDRVVMAIENLDGATAQITVGDFRALLAVPK